MIWGGLTDVAGNAIYRLSRNAKIEPLDETTHQ